TIINPKKPKDAKEFYFIALINNTLIKCKLDEGLTNTIMGFNHAQILELHNLIPKPAIAEAVENNVKILGKMIVDIKINEFLTKQIKIDVLNTSSKYILFSNKTQTELGIIKDIQNQ
ncbi:2303_t:CDS:1, partial [Dentiscutata heterogama]